MFTESITPSPLDFDVHDPTRRRVLGRRALFEVRAAPGRCALGLPWLPSGLWHVQVLPLGVEASLSTLVFPDLGAPAPFFVRLAPLLRGLWLSADDLDEVWRDHTHQSDVSQRFVDLARQLHDRALAAWVRQHASRRGLAEIAVSCARDASLVRGLLD